MPWSRESRHKRGYGTDWDQTRKRILDRDDYLCQCRHCKAEGRTSVATEVDHIIPKAQGGSDDDGNLQAINHDCHIRKTIEDAGGEPKGRRQRHKPRVVMLQPRIRVL